MPWPWYGRIIVGVLIFFAVIIAVPMILNYGENIAVRAGWLAPASPANVGDRNVNVRDRRVYEDRRKRGGSQEPVPTGRTRCEPPANLPADAVRVPGECRWTFWRREAN